MLTLENFENPPDLMHVFNCNTDWPICLFDFTIKQKCPNYFAFKVQMPLNTFRRENYFYDDKDSAKVVEGGPFNPPIA